MAEERRKIQLHKKGDQNDQWVPLTTGDSVQLTTYKNDGVTSGPIHNAVDDANNGFDDLNTALMKLENRPDFTGATDVEEGTNGLVPKPSVGDKDKFLKGDGTWAEVEAEAPNDNEVTIQVNGTSVDTFTLNQDSDKTINIQLADVAVSNSYNDLDDKPTIPEVNDATIKVQINGEDFTNNTFTLNQQSSNAIIIDIPIPSYMEYRGTITSESQLTTPSTLAQKKKQVGCAYKVASSFTFNTDKTAKIGDVFIYAKIDENNFAWTHIPSGDDNYVLDAATSSALGGIKLGYTQNNRKYPIELDSNDKAFVEVPSDNTDTHRAIKVDGVATNMTSSDNTALNLVGGTNVTLSESNGSVTINATDTTYSNLSEASGSNNVSLVTAGEKYIWNHKSDLTLGNTANTAAAGNHTHNISLATDSGTSAIDLAPNTVYKLTAGGQNIIFKTPQNTTTTISGGTGISVSSNNEISVKLGYTSSGNNRAVQADSSGNLYVVQKDDNTTYSGGTGISISSNQISVKLGYTSSGNNRAVQADSNGNLYVTQKDDNTTYSGGTGIDISSNQISVKLGYTTSGNNRAVQADSNGKLYVVQKDDNTTYSNFGVSTSNAGSAGLVPAPSANDKAKFLNSGSGWVALAVDETKTVSSNAASFAVVYGHNYFVGGANISAIASGNAVNSLTITGISSTDNPTGADFEANIFFKAGASFTKPTFSNNTPMLIGELPTFEANGIYLMSLYKGTVIFGTLSSYTNA